MKRGWMFLLALMVALALCGCGRQESPIEDFVYEMQDGEVVITGYTGTDREIVIPEKIVDRPVTIIGDDAFCGYDLTYIELPDTVTEIQEAAFADCRCLEKVVFSQKLEIINNNSFSNCEELKEIELPNSVQRIGAGAFQNSGLELVSLPEDLQYLGEDAFGNCDNLEYLTIPDDVDLIIYTQRSSASVDGVSVIATRFYSFVGSSTCMQYYGNINGHLPENSDFDKLSTVVIVNEGSFAHQQLQEYEKFGVITYKLK